MDSVTTLQDELDAALAYALAQRKTLEACPRTRLIGRAIDKWLLFLEARQIAVETALGVLGSLKRHGYPALAGVAVTDSMLAEIARGVDDAMAAAAIFSA